MVSSLLRAAFCVHRPGVPVQHEATGVVPCRVRARLAIRHHHWLYGTHQRVSARFEQYARFAVGFCGFS